MLYADRQGHNSCLQSPAGGAKRGYAIRWNLPFCPCSGRNITVHCNSTREHLNGSAPPWLSRVGDPAELASGLNPVPNLLGGRVTATSVTTATTGTNNIQISAKDAAGNTTTHTWQVVATSGTNQTLTYDPDGNLLNDGTQTYEWDAANRLTAVNEPGNLRSEFTYDGLSRRVFPCRLSARECFLGVRLHFSTALSIGEGLWAVSVRATCSCESAGSRLLRCSSLNVRKSSSDPLMYSPPATLLQG